MAFIVFENGKSLGEVENWSQREDPPTYKTFLGKTALLKPANNECTFVSPKPVRRKAILKIIGDARTEYTVEVLKAVGGTEVTAKILETKILK
jgi:hypothetical protein